MTAFNKTWVFIKNVDQPYDDLSAARKLHEIEEKIKQLEQQREIIRQMRGNMGNVDPRAHPDWEQKPVPPYESKNDMKDFPPEGNTQRYPGEITTPAPDPNNPNVLHPDSNRNPFKTNFAPMCEVCKATPALLNSRMCGTCTNEKEAIEQRNQQSRNNLQDRQDVSDSFIDYR